MSVRDLKAWGSYYLRGFENVETLGFLKFGTTGCAHRGMNTKLFYEYCNAFIKPFFDQLDLLARS